jgi:UDP-glucose 4-epimerase
VVEGDICDRALVDELTRGCDVVFHQAALRITQCVDEPRLAVEVMCNGTFNVVESVVRHGVRKLVAASSASVYGAATSFPTREDHHPYGNETLYGAAKTFNEGLMRSFAATQDLEYVALRYFNVYGPRMDIHGVYTEVLVRWMERIDEGLSPLIHGTGEHTMDFIYIGDIARANLLAATSPATDEVFNVASGEETSLLELAEALIDVMDADVDVEFGPERAAAKVPRRLADTSLAAERLGFRAEVGLEEGLHRLVEWWRAERERDAAPLAAA